MLCGAPGVFQIFAQKTDFCPKKWNFLGYPQIFSRISSKYMAFRNIFWGTPEFFNFLVKKWYFDKYYVVPPVFFNIYVKKLIISGVPQFFSDLCRKNWYFEKYFGLPTDFYLIFVKNINIFFAVAPYFFHILVKNIDISKMWGTPRFFNLRIVNFNAFIISI